MNKLCLGLAILIALSVSVEAATVSGNWRVGTTFDDPNLPGGTLTCALTQMDERLTGGCHPPNGADVQVTGEVEGATVKWQFDVVIQPGTPPMTARYTGTLNDKGTAIEGTLTLAGMTGRFTATKE